ncbi:MAG: nucleotidyltransferase domain-containing protein [Candidatus Omnitrophica bacterium]|nr:nucleotidyltransferase domain-containing protein [Candidatus Omnitrophota bacterium]
MKFSTEIPSLGPTVRKKLKRLGVALVYLYGSEAIGRSSALSDIDVGIVFRDSGRLRDRRRRFHLRSDLVQCLGSVLAPGFTREIDLVFLQSASAILRFEATKFGRLLFVAAPLFWANYEASVLKEYLDVHPLVEVHYQAVLERAA